MTTEQIRNVVRKAIKEKDNEILRSIPKKDLKIFVENERARKNYSPDGVKNLYKGICEYAIENYKSEHKMRLFPLNPNRIPQKTNEEKNLEEFFNSDFFLNNTGLRSKEHTIEVIEKTMIEDEERKEREKEKEGKRKRKKKK